MDRTSDNWEGVVLSGWMAEIGEPDSVSWNSKTDTNGNLAPKPKLANLLVNVFCQNLFGLKKKNFIVLICFDKCPKSSSGACKEKYV